MIKTEEKQEDLSSTDSRALFVLAIAGIIIGIIQVLNATLVFDDLILPSKFSDLKATLGWFRALLKIFCLDLPTEYRTYGLSRGIQFVLWSLGAASAPIYAGLISFSQFLTTLALYSLLSKLRTNRIMSFSFSWVWLFSPFIATSCFHHYSYLILPSQLAIIYAYFLVTIPGAGSNRIYAVVLGAAIGLTGEMHLLAAVLILIAVAAATHNREKYRSAILAIGSMTAAIALHYSVWKAFVSNPMELHRFSPNLAHKFDYWIRLIMAAINAIFRSFITQLEEFSGGEMGFFCWATIVSSSIIFAALVWLFRRYRSVLEIRVPSVIRLSSILFAISLSYFIVFVSTGVLSDSVPQIMYRRYGFVPFTVLCGVVVLIAHVILTPKYGKMLLVSIALGAITALTIHNQVVGLPLTNKADGRLSAKISKEMHNDHLKSVLFFIASNTEFPKISFGMAEPGPAMRTLMGEEVSQAKYGTGWPASLTVTHILGAMQGCAITHIINEKAIAACLSGQASVDCSRSLIVANLGFEPLDPMGEHVRVFSNCRDFNPYFFAKRIDRVPLESRANTIDEFAVDLGQTNTTCAVGAMPDKRFGDPIKPCADWIENYGWLSGANTIYENSSLGRDLSYYRTNRYGDFSYSLVLREQSSVQVSFDFWEQWNRQPGERRFKLEVSWDGHQWADVGDLDLAAINGYKPFSI